MNTLTYEILKTLDGKKIHLVSKIHTDFLVQQLDNKYKIWVNKDETSPNYGVWIMKPRATRRGIRVNSLTFDSTFENPTYQLIK